jgi:hypothetical protein
MKLFNLLRLFALAMMFMAGGVASASIETACGTTTWNLTAGQTIKVQV